MTDPVATASGTLKADAMTDQAGLQDIAFDHLADEEYRDRHDDRHPVRQELDQGDGDRDDQWE